MMRRLWRLLLTVLVILWAAHIQAFIRLTSASSFSVAQWSLAQWLPSSVGVLTRLAASWQAQAWDEWEKQLVLDNDVPWEVSVVSLRDLRDPTQILQHLKSRHGKDWRKRPLLLKELWNGAAEILGNKSRRLSLSGLLQEDLLIPYFRDATIPGALTPDSQARISEIVANISNQEDCRHKITTQLMLETYPELIHEVAPVNIVTELFGDFFDPDRIRGTGPFHLLPAMTTVPMFVARSANTTADATKQPRTDLHCEPIGNVAVQLEGSKQWTLVLRQDSFRLRPLLAPDGRAYVASMVSTQEEWKGVPRAQVVTHAGDALWVPPWTWHRVDYVSSTHAKQRGLDQQASMVSLGASLFHFRPKDFFLNNPLFALLILPNLFKELVGYNTQ